MKPLFIIGNWKSNKTLAEVNDWFTQFQGVWTNTTLSPDTNLDVILAIPFVFVEAAHKHSETFKRPIAIAAQNVSPFSDGAYTGEVSAHMLSGLVTYCLIGHSERRKYFSETDELLAQKAEQLKTASIEPILCVPEAQTPIPATVRFVAYEPVWAIGSGKPATPEHAHEIAVKIKERRPDVTIIYGGSVTADNVAGFVTQPTINGVLPGGASLDPNTFYQLINNAKNAVSAG